MGCVAEFPKLFEEEFVGLGKSCAGTPPGTATEDAV